jgi:hypothetical protein
MSTATANQPSRSGRTAAGKIVLLTLRSLIRSRDDNRLSELLTGNVDWDYLLALSYFQDVSPMIAHILTRDEYCSYIPEPYQKRLQRSYLDNVNRNIILANELVKVIEMFGRHGIETIALKGTALAEQLYVNPIPRITHDIDVLVHKDQLSNAKSLLQEMGYSLDISQDEPDHPFHSVFQKRNGIPLMLELHWDLEDPRLLITPLSEIWRRTQQQRVEGSSVRVLSPEDTLVYISHDIFKETSQQLKYLSDITALLEKFGGTLNWSLVTAITKSLGTETTLYYSLKWVKELLEAPVPDEVLGNIRPAIWKRGLIWLLIDSQKVLTSARWSKLDSETFTLALSLMMGRLNQSITVQVKFRSDNANVISLWLSTITWIPPVLVAALYRKVAGLFARKHRE